MTRGAWRAGPSTLKREPTRSVGQPRGTQIPDVPLPRPPPRPPYIVHIHTHIDCSPRPMSWVALDFGACHIAASMRVLEHPAVPPTTYDTTLARAHDDVYSHDMCRYTKHPARGDPTPQTRRFSLSSALQTRRDRPPRAGACCVAHESACHRRLRTVEEVDHREHREPKAAVDGGHEHAEGGGADHRNHAGGN